MKRRIVVLAVLLVVGGIAPPAAALADTFHLAPSGSDSNSCSSAAPCRTVARSNTVCQAGDTVVLHAGDYGAEGTRTSFTKAGCTWRGASGEAQPRILGEVYTNADNARVSGVNMEGPTGDVGGNVTSLCGINESGKFWINGAHGFRLDHSQVHGSVGYFGVFFNAGAAVEIDHDHIYDNGCFLDEQATGTRAHGIYADNGTFDIHDNLIDHNHAFGIQVYPQSDGGTIAYNTITGNRSGLILGGAANTQVANNIIAGNRLWGIECYGAPATGNTATNNLFWDNLDGQISNPTWCMSSVTGSMSADPLFAADGYHLTAGSPAIGFASGVFTSATDIDDQARDPHPDAGADEYASASPTPTPTATATPTPTASPTPTATPYDPACAPTCDEQIAALKDRLQRIGAIAAGP